MAIAAGTIEILHVDDEPGFAEMVADFLEREDSDIKVKSLTTVSEGLDYLGENGKDCVVSDFDMPGQTGIDFLEAVRSRYPDLPFILFTGKGSEEIASRAISAGVTEYLQKEAGTEQYAVLANRIRNLVDKRRAEVESERLRAHQQAITENISDAIVTIDSNSTIIFANQGVEGILGYSPGEVEGEPLTQVMPERYREEHTNALGRYLTTGERRNDWQNADFQALHDDGHEVPVSVSFGEFEQDGEPRFVGVIRDMTEQKERTEQLLENEAELRMYERVVESSTDLLAAVDSEYTYIFANDRYLAFHGLDSDDIGNRTIPEVLDDEWETGVKDHIDRAMAGEKIQYEMERMGAEGEVRTFDIRYYPLRDTAGTIIGTIGAMRDVTDLEGRDPE